jgi:hypothetical protein
VGWFVGCSWCFARVLFLIGLLSSFSLRAFCLFSFSERQEGVILIPQVLFRLFGGRPRAGVILWSWFLPGVVPI